MIVGGKVENAGVFQSEDLGGEKGGLRADDHFVGAPAARIVCDGEVGVGA